MKTNRTNCTIKTVILSTEERPTYQDYLDWCKATDETPENEDSESFFSWQEQQAETEFESKMKEIEDFEDYSTTVLVEGTLGRWNGQKEIIPTEFGSVSKALKTCVERCADLTVEYDNGMLKVKAFHHDGVNLYTIRKKDRRKKLLFLYS